MSSDGSSATARAQHANTKHASRMEYGVTVSATERRTYPPRTPVRNMLSHLPFLPASSPNAAHGSLAQLESCRAAEKMGMLKMGMLDKRSRPLSLFANTPQGSVGPSTVQVIPKYNGRPSSSGALSSAGVSRRECASMAALGRLSSCIHQSALCPVDKCLPLRSRNRRFQSSNCRCQDCRDQFRYKYPRRDEHEFNGRILSTESASRHVPD